jgi:hypothetical protein
METVAVMMVMKKLLKSPIRSEEQDHAAPENEDHEGGGALDLVKLRHPRNRFFSNI